ncbi:oxidoreductase [Balneolaceae bacterium ANBcel3]|nr:oxidoreductase [Balneolaceae bacterium ANBcel3]
MSIQTGLISFGKASRIFHAPVITSVPGLELVSVVERHKNESQNEYPWLNVVRSTEELLKNDDIRLIVIATPNDTHFDIAKASLMAGKHVVVEKPFTITTTEARELTDLARQNGLIISAFQNRRWDGDFLTVKEILNRKSLGRLVAFESRFDRFRNYHRPEAWRERPGRGAGLLYDLGPHLIDQALVLFGMPLSVTADIRAQRNQAETDDFFHLRLDYPDLRVILEAGMLVGAETPRFMLHGTKGSFMKFGLDPQESKLSEGFRPSDDSEWGEEEQRYWGTLHTYADDKYIKTKVKTLKGDYRLFYENIAQAIKGKADPFVTVDQMIKTIEIIEKAFVSQSQKKSVMLDS